MYKNILKTSVLVLLLGFPSCKNVQPKAEEIPVVTYEMYEADFRASLTSADTSEVLKLSDSLMNCLQSKRYEDAFKMLYTVQSDGMHPVSESTVQVLRTRFENYPVCDYSLQYYSFSTPELNDVKYSYQFSKTSKNGNLPSMSFMLNPIKYEGKWYLCVKDRRQKSKDVLEPIHPQMPVN